MVGHDTTLQPGSLKAKINILMVLKVDVQSQGAGQGSFWCPLPWQVDRRMSSCCILTCGSPLREMGGRRKREREKEWGKGNYYTKVKPGWRGISVVRSACCFLQRTRVMILPYWELTTACNSDCGGLTLFSGSHGAYAQRDKIKKIFKNKSKMILV